MKGYEISLLVYMAMYKGDVGEIGIGGGDQ